MVVGNHPRSHGRLWFGTRDLIKNLLLVTALTVMLLHEGYLLFNAGKHGAFPTARDLSFETPYPSGNPEEAIADELWLPQLGPLQSTNTMEEDQDAETKKEEEEQEATLLLEERPLLKDIPREIALIHVGKAGGMVRTI